MLRTKNRVFAKNLLNIKFAIFFAFILFFLGIFYLIFFVNLIVLFFSLLGFFIYVFLYTFLLKKRSIYSTLIGSISGALPSVIGCFIVKPVNYLCALILFFMLICWQQVHFYAISLFYFEDYKNSKMPIFTIIHPLKKTIKHMYFYTICFIVFSSFLTFFKFIGLFYFYISLILGVFWLFLIYKLNEIKHLTQNSKYVFKFSLIYIFILNLLMIFNHL